MLGLPMNTIFFHMVLIPLDFLIQKSVVSAKL